ncbi:MAG TPA: ABC transporter permease subunit [Candidatus Aminicenantes bacterium]|nr:ABC transporter permease subunit [Candidatus Aminicenantes bacterium]HOS11735.1 ABC transporter permease subunit [Candidatus Aminicenantes bacterium]HPL13713.1 ABC transporter permease subunit [Candidatus Aminicenantes bacterium]HQH45557.1 ABC transporter permease subunit [Candidatus Aminicenantes bacterium]
MLKTIIRKETLETILSYRFPLFTLICLLLIPLGLFVNQADYGKRLRDYQEQTRLADEAAKSLKIQDVMAGTVAIKGFRRPSPLSVFTQGFENTFPAYYEFTQDGFTAGESSGGSDSILSAQGKVDFVFLVQMVVSLIALLFASDMISGEKEAGTLRAMLSNPLPRDALLAGKAGGGFLALWIPFLLSFLVGLAVLLFAGFPLFGGDGVVRITTVFLVSSLFVLTYFVIGLAVSSTTAKARTSLVAILILWTAFQLIIPKMSDMAARLIHPVRTDTEVSLQKSILVRTLDMEQARELGREYDRIYANAPESAQEDNSPERKRWDPLRDGIQQRYRERKSRELGAIDETFFQERRRQTNLALNLSLISPSAAFARLISDVCGTGELERSRYAAAVRSHQNALDAELFNKVKRTVMLHDGGHMSVGFTAMPVDASKLPKFSIAPVTLAEAFKANGRSLVSLFLWLIVPYAFAYVKFLRYDVR